MRHSGQATPWVRAEPHLSSLSLDVSSKERPVGWPKAPSCGGSPREGARSAAEQRLAAGGSQGSPDPDGQGRDDLEGGGDAPWPPPGRAEAVRRAILPARVQLAQTAVDNPV